MSTAELAHEFLSLLAAGKESEAQALWSDTVVSIESMPGPNQVCRGRQALLAKHAWWNANMTVHGVTTEGPFINGDQFAARFSVDCTGPDHQRITFTEMALYTVQEGRITEERFFPLPPATP